VNKLTFLLKPIAVIAFTSSLLVTTNAIASTVYTYRDSAGHVHITNKAPNRSKSHTVLNKVRFKPYRDRKSSNNSYFAKAKKSQYDTLITEIANQHKVDAALVKSVVHIESAFQNEAVSRAGALGLMQLMPKTAAHYGLNDDHFNPRKNITVGVTHLKGLLKRYKGDKRLSLAAYNAGETAVAKYDGIPPFKETQNYVVKVLSLYEKYQDQFSG